jgi:hypothetical protein
VGTPVPDVSEDGSHMDEEGEEDIDIEENESTFARYDVDNITSLLQQLGNVQLLINRMVFRGRYYDSYWSTDTPSKVSQESVKKTKPQRSRKSQEQAVELESPVQNDKPELIEQQAVDRDNLLDTIEREQLELRELEREKELRDNEERLKQADNIPNADPIPDNVEDNEEEKVLKSQKGNNGKRKKTKTTQDEAQSEVRDLRSRHH